MMKRILSLLVALGAVLAAGAAFAGVDTTPHEFGTAAYGMCEVCHVPHAASAVTDTRLWREDRSFTNNTTWDQSTIGALCGTCHNGGALDATVNINGISATSQATLAYDETNHARNWNTLTVTMADTQDALTGKPYTSGTKIEANMIECSSCHNPHQDALRPFLRENADTGAATISGFCADCHLNRYSEEIFDNSTAATTGDDNHPVNVLYIDDGGTGVSNGNTKFRLNPITTVTTLVNAMTYGTDGNATWPLGGKFEGALTAAPANWNTEDIGCGTCHSVHDKAAQTVAGDAALHLLANNNTGAGASLCEGCHGGPLNKAFSSYSTVGIGPDHPIDMLPGTGGGPGIDRWFAQAGATIRDERTSNADTQWPRGSGGNIICTSCHSAHKSQSADYARLTRDNWAAGINTEDAFCTACHKSPSPLAHHSHESNSTSSLTCAQCHGGGGGAHNGFVFSLSDTENQYSNLCARCHLYNNLVAPFNSYNQTQSTDWAQQDPAFILGDPGYTNHLPGATGGSHYLGTFANNSTTVWVKRSAWTYGKSKYGATRAATGWGNPAGANDSGNVMICESCHNVLWNFGAMSTAATPTLSSGWENDLLLMDYRDDASDLATAQAVGSGLCVGCHNQNDAGSAAGAVNHSLVELSGTVPIGTHPMTAWDITRAVDSGRATTTLVTTTGDGTYADGAIEAAAGTGGALNGGASRGPSYPDQDKMDCDSCHTPHRAAGDGSTTGLYNGCQTQPGVSLPVILENSGPLALEFENLCLDCHAY